MKRYTLPAALTNFSTKAIPAPHHVKVAPFVYPFFQQHKPVWKGNILIAPFFPVKKIRMKHQHFCFHIAKHNYIGPFQPLAKIFRRHIIEFPGWLGNYVCTRYALHRIYKFLCIVHNLYAFGGCQKRRFNIFLPGVYAPVTYVPDV